MVLDKHCLLPMLESIIERLHLHHRVQFECYQLTPLTLQLLIQALEVDNAYQEPLLILSDLYRSEEDYESLIGLLQYVDEEDLDPVFMWHLAFALGQEDSKKC